VRVQDLSRIEVVILIIAGILAGLSLCLLVYWRMFLGWLAPQFPGDTEQAAAVALLFVLAFSFAEAFIIGLLLSSHFRVNRWLSMVFQLGSTPSESNIRGWSAYVLGSMLITTIFMTVVYVVPAIPGGSSLPSIFGISFSFAKLLNNLASPGEPLAAYIQVGLMTSGPATMFWARLEGIYHVTTKPREGFAKICSYAMWLTVLALFAYFLSGGGTVQGVPLWGVLLIWALQSAFIALVVFYPLEKLIGRFSGPPSHPEE